MEYFTFHGWRLHRSSWSSWSSRSSSSSSRSSETVSDWKHRNEIEFFVPGWNCEIPAHVINRRSYPTLLLLAYATLSPQSWLQFYFTCQYYEHSQPNYLLFCTFLCSFCRLYVTQNVSNLNIITSRLNYNFVGVVFKRSTVHCFRELTED